MLGLLLMVTAVLLLVVTGIIALADLHTWWLVAPVAIGLLAIAGGAVWVSRTNPAVRFTDEGYVVKGFRGAGEKQGRWKDVEDIITTYRGDLPCVEIRLKKGVATTIPVTLLAADREHFVRDLQRHAKAGQGYRNL